MFRKKKISTASKGESKKFKPKFGLLKDKVGGLGFEAEPEPSPTQKKDAILRKNENDGNLEPSRPINPPKEYTEDEIVKEPIKPQKQKKEMPKFSPVRKEDLEERKVEENIEKFIPEVKLIFNQKISEPIEENKVEEKRWGPPVRRKPSRSKINPKILEINSTDTTNNSQSRSKYYQIGIGKIQFNPTLNLSTLYKKAK